MYNDQPGSTAREIILEDDNQKSVCCPPHDNEAVWREHPRVYLALDADGQVRCPYCSTLYKLKTD